MTTASKLVTVWLLTEQGRQLAGHADAERAWAEMEATPPFSEHRSRWFTPVEISIAPEDAPRAVAKWERVAGQAGVCHVEARVPQPGDRRNEVYGR